MQEEQRKIRLFTARDDIFHRQRWPKPFEFNESVAEVFDNMVSRSVPLYVEVVENTVDWALRSYQQNTAILDIGCSTGTVLDLVGRSLQQPAHLVGLDPSQPMLEKAKEKLKELEAKHTVDLVCQEAENHDFGKTSVVIVNYTLQFIPIAKRAHILQKIYDSLVPGGVFILSEKVTSEDPEMQEAMTTLYESFKERQGYSKTEIERKK